MEFLKILVAFTEDFMQKNHNDFSMVETTLGGAISGSHCGFKDEEPCNVHNDCKRKNIHLAILSDLFGMVKT